MRFQRWKPSQRIIEKVGSIRISHGFQILSGLIRIDMLRGRISARSQRRHSVGQGLHGPHTGLLVTQGQHGPLHTLRVIATILDPSLKSFGHLNFVGTSRIIITFFHLLDPGLLRLDLLIPFLLDGGHGQIAGHYIIGSWAQQV
jgi:hypothetical protein